MPLTFEQLKAQLKDDQEKALLDKILKENQEAVKGMEFFAAKGEEWNQWALKPDGFPAYQQAYEEVKKLKPELEAARQQAEALQKELEARKAAAVKPGEVDENGNPKPQEIDIEKLGAAIMAKMKASGEIVT